MAERVVLSIGTKKAPSSPKRRSRAASSIFAGRTDGGRGLQHVDRHAGKPSVYASSCNAFFGMKILKSTDMGKTFKETKAAPAFPKDDGRALANIWSIEPGPGKKELWCGVEPAALFRSDNGGDSWEMVPGISNHEHARQWQPGNGGLCMHTIVRDGEPRAPRHLDRRSLPERGRRRHVPARRIRASAPASRRIRIPSSASACTRSSRHEDAPGRLYMQNHGGWANWDGPGGPRPDIGVLRSDDPRQDLAVDRQGAAVRLRLPDRRASARPRHGLRACRSSR